MKVIFVTVGTQLPFDRLLSSIDRWAGNNSDTEVIIQACSSDVEFENIKVTQFFSPQEYKEIVARCDVIIGHAGMGTIITAHEHNTPLVIMSRLYKLGEHRNDHQLSTAKKFREVKGVYVVDDEASLFEVMGSIDTLNHCSSDPTPARTKLIAYIKNDFLGMA